MTSTRLTAVRAILAVLGGVQLLDGLYALFAPRSFYGDFPAGRGWVEALPAYNEHLVRDVGSLFLATAVVLIAAALWPERRLILVALVSFLVFSVPHGVYHAFNLGPYDTGDAIANVVTLGFTVVAPIWALWAMRRPAPAKAAGAAAPSGEGARIEPVRSSANPVVKMALSQAKKEGGGTLMAPVTIFAHAPGILAGYGALETATGRADRVSARLKHLAVMRAAAIAGCEWCLDFGSARGRDEGVTDEDLRALAAYSNDPTAHFDELERLVLDYATGMSRSPVDVADELFARLREHFDEAQLVELTNIVAIENYRARFNWAFGLESQGYAEGSYCVPPAASSA